MTTWVRLKDGYLTYTSRDHAATLVEAGIATYAYPDAERVNPNPWGVFALPRVRP